MLHPIPPQPLPAPNAGLMAQFLAWVAARPRTYDDAMDAWRTSCPRLSVWEDALAEGLVRVEAQAAGGQREARVVLTPAGAARIGA